MRSHIFGVMIIISIKDIPNKEQHSHAHALLRECLKKYNIDYSVETPVAKNPYGKPSLRDFPEIHYNLSHADGIAACMVGSRECGIDCEKVREFRPNVMKRTFTEKEREAVISAPENMQDLMFFRIWTLKEAYIKAVGRGLSFPLKDAEFIINGDKITSNITDCQFKQYIVGNGKFVVSTALLC